MLARTALVFVALSSTIYAAPVTYSDGTFNNADWQTSIVYQGYNGGTVSTQQVISGGTPGSYQEVDATLNTAKSSFFASTIFAFHQRTSAIYNPATQGAIGSIDLRIDVLNKSAPTRRKSVSQLQQNGKVYIPSPLQTSAPSAAWTHYTELNLTQGQFGQEVSAGSADAQLVCKRATRFLASPAPNFVGYYTAQRDLTFRGEERTTPWPASSIRRRNPQGSATTTCRPSPSCPRYPIPASRLRIPPRPSP